MTTNTLPAETEETSFEAIQKNSAKILSRLQWLHLPLVAIMGFYTGSDNLIAALVLTALLSAVSTFSYQAAPSAVKTRCLLATSYAMQAATFVFLLSGHPWQIDMHMYFFAVLAITVALMDSRAILTAAGAIALHHLVLNVIAPAWVFPGGTDFVRVVVHAVVVVLQTTALLWLTVKLQEMSDIAETKRAEAHSANKEQEALIIELNTALAVADEQSKEVEVARQKLQDENTQREEVFARLEKAFSRVAKGDLTTRLDEPFLGGYEVLRQDFNASLQALELMLSDVIDQVSGIQFAIKDINKTADAFSSRTEYQATSLEQTASSLDAVTTTVESTAEGTRSADDLIHDTKSSIEKSGEVVSRAVEAMGEIERSSEKIAAIVAVIDEIAAQTNLLALNAGVEAARAGDAGQGFSVVAVEVRRLSQRSSEAAKEISEIISVSQNHVGKGVALVDEAGGALETIVEKVVSFSKLMSDISQSTNDQAMSLSDVNNEVNRLSTLTQENAAMVEQSASASQKLSSAATELSTIVQRFKINAANQRFVQRRDLARSA